MMLGGEASLEEMGQWEHGLQGSISFPCLLISLCLLLAFHTIELLLLSYADLSCCPALEPDNYRLKPAPPRGQNKTFLPNLRVTGCLIFCLSSKTLRQRCTINICWIHYGLITYVTILTRIVLKCPTHYVLPIAFSCEI